MLEGIVKGVNAIQRATLIGSNFTTLEEAVPEFMGALDQMALLSREEIDAELQALKGYSGAMEPTAYLLTGMTLTILRHRAGEGARAEGGRTHLTNF